MSNLKEMAQATAPRKFRVDPDFTMDILFEVMNKRAAAFQMPFERKGGIGGDRIVFKAEPDLDVQLNVTVNEGIVKLQPKARFWVMAIGFTASVLFFGIVYLSGQFVPLCIAAFLASFCNCAGNTVFNASLMLALPEENRGAILGFIQSASVGGTALSAVIFGVLGDVFPMYLVFTVGNLLSLGPMLYMCFHRDTKSFILEH